MPFFSIVIPVYNRAELLQPTLRAILEQGFIDYEIILVDDGSTDRIQGMVEGFTRENKNIRYVYQQNSERGSARNNGIRHALGTYVVMFDSDDLMHPDHLEVLHSGILAMKHPDFITTKFDFVRQGRHTDSDIMRIQEGYYDYRLFLHGNPFACNICFRRDQTSLFFFEEDRKYAMMEDWMFLMQNLRNKRVYLIDKVTISLNDHESRSMRGNQSSLVEKAQFAFLWMKERVALTKPETRILEAQIEYFSAIHCYLDNRRILVAKHLARAIATNGMKARYAVLLLKSIPGHKFLVQFKH